MGAELEISSQDQPSFRICRKCVDIVCFEKTGIQGRMMHWIPENITVVDKQPIESCFRREIFKYAK